jgi:PAS domain S-box-containing protein
MSKRVKSDLLTIAEKEKAKREEELVIAKADKAEAADELIIANIEKEKLLKELTILNKELMQAYKQEKLAKEEYIELYNFAPSGYLTLTREGKIVESNHLASKILGKEHSLLKDLGFANFVSDDTKPIFNQFLEQIFKSKTKQLCDVMLLTYSDLPVYVYLIGIVTKNAEQCLVTIVDISQRKQVEDALYESEEKYSKAFQSSPYSIAITSAEDGKFIEVNDAFTLVSGYTREEVTTNSAIGLDMWVDKEKQRSVISTLLDGRDVENKEFLFKKKNGEIITGLFSARIIKINNKLCIISSINDITQRKRAEEALKKSELLLTLSIENQKDTIIFSTDQNYRYLYFNKAHSDFMKYAYNKDIKTGMNILNCITSDDDRLVAKENYDLALRGESHTDVRMCGDINRAFYESFFNPITNEKNEIIGVTGLARNITERKQYELELIKAKEKAEESDKLKSTLLTKISHEIRTPMDGILGFAELLKEPNLTGEEQQNFIKTIGISGTRMLNTINNVDDFSKIESGLMKVNKKDSNINEQIEFVYNFFKPEVESKGMQFSFKNGLPSNEAIIKTDFEKIYSVLINLVKNAIKYSDKGSIEFGYEKLGKYLEFFVKDCGIGIPIDKQEAIFEHFIQSDIGDTRASQITDLGLAISKSYVEILGGKIWVESKEGKGSIFYFTVPYNAVSEEKNAIKNAVIEMDTEIQIKNLKILIADDDEISRYLLTLRIKNFSREILNAKTGVEAVDSCRSNPNLDLVLMDIKMPDMDGYEATRQIRQFNKDVIIIAQTAYAFYGNNEKAIEAGCNDYITKPINHTLLKKLIKKHCSK